MAELMADIFSVVWLLVSVLATVICSGVFLWQERPNEHNLLWVWVGCVALPFSITLVLLVGCLISPVLLLNWLRDKTQSFKKRKTNGK